MADSGLTDKVIYKQAQYDLNGNLIQEGEVHYEQDFFKMQQPLSHFLRVQFRIPDILGEQLEQSNELNKGLLVYDESSYVSQNSERMKQEGRLPIYKEKTSDPNRFEYWVDVTQIKKDETIKYLNNFAIGMSMEDKGGVKEISLNLFDKYWRNIEGILTFALQCMYLSKNRNEIKGTLKTGDKNKNSDSDKPEIAIQSIFVNPNSIENMRIKFGYPKNYTAPSLGGKNFIPKEGQFLDDSQNDVKKSTVEDWDIFNKRKTGEMCLDTPWIRFIILEAKRSIQSEGCNFAIKGVSSISVLLDKIELTREYAVIKATTFNILNIVNDPFRIYLEANADKCGITDLLDIKKGLIKKDQDVLNKLFQKNAFTDFLEVFYNPINAFKNGGELPRKAFMKKVNGNSTIAVEADIEYDLLDSPSSSLFNPPKDTLGNILSEILYKIPPKRYARRKNPINGEFVGPLLEIAADKESAESSKHGLKNLNEEYLFLHNDVIPYKNIELVEEENKPYKFKLLPINKDKTDLNSYGNRLVFYYDDPGFTQDEIRCYQPRSHRSIVEDLTIDEDMTFEMTMTKNLRPVGKIMNSKIESVMKLFSGTNLDTENLKQALRDFNFSEIDIDTKLKEIKKNVGDNVDSETKLSIQNLKDLYEGKDDDIYDGTYPTGISFGGLTLRGDSGFDTLRAIAYGASNKATITFAGDPYWLFDAKVVAGISTIAIRVKRPKFNSMEMEDDIFYSGQYYVLGIKHNIDPSTGFTTTLSLQKIPGLSDIFENIYESRKNASNGVNDPLTDLDLLDKNKEIDQNKKNNKLKENSEKEKTKLTQTKETILNTLKKGKPIDSNLFIVEYNETKIKPKIQYRGYETEVKAVVFQIKDKKTGEIILKTKPFVITWPGNSAANNYDFDTNVKKTIYGIVRADAVRNNKMDTNGGSTTITQKQNKNTDTIIKN